MPKKRNSIWSRNKKEKQIITARLIEISLKVDDYVYNHKPLTECEAEQFIREVASYKLQCSRDERSLQVIEKLTRCMKAIILDHQEIRENNGYSIPDANIRSGTVSPVYSIPDEDRTQLSQLAEEPASRVTGTNNDIEIIDLIGDDEGPNERPPAYEGSRITVEVDIHRAISNLSIRDDPIEVISETCCSQSILNNFEEIAEVQANNLTTNAISKNVGGVADEAKRTNVWKAENILADITNKNIQPNNVQNIAPILITKQNESVKPLYSNNENPTNNKVQNMQDEPAVPTKMPNTITNTNNRIATAYQNANSKISNTIINTTNTVPETQRLTWFESNRTCTVNNFRQPYNEAGHLTQSANIFKVNTNPNIAKSIADRNVDTGITLKGDNRFTPPTQILIDNQTKPKTSAAKVNEAARMKTFPEIDNDINLVSATKTTGASINNNILLNNTEKTTAPKKKRAPRKKKTSDDKEIKPIKKVFRAPKTVKGNTVTMTQKDKNIPIYNRNIENDLSWMENIRYVREIKADENDPKLNFEETFWDNYYLPANWNDSEFM